MPTITALRRTLKDPSQTKGFTFECDFKPTIGDSISIDSRTYTVISATFLVDSETNTSKYLISMTDDPCLLNLHENPNDL